jgi:hypothetical protein
LLTDRRFRLARIWSNEELARIAPLFEGEVVNVSAWQDSDKVSRRYRDYFNRAASYATTNYAGFRGYAGREGEFELDLTGELPEGLRARFDVVFNHTTLEHVFEVRRAFANLCAMSRDVVIVVVPFAQVQHESESWKDFWRFTPTCLRELYRENGLRVVYEAANSPRNAAIYLLFVGARRAEKWRERLPAFTPIATAGSRIGDVPHQNAIRSLRRAAGRVLRPGRRTTPPADPELS